MSRRSLLLVLLPGLALTLWLGWLSDGAYHDDDLTHFLMARWARWFPGYLLHLWGRPGFTVPMSLVAWIGDPAMAWHACRAFSALITACTAYLAVRLGERYGLSRPWLIVPACYLQPLNVLLATTTLTENLCALYLLGAVVLLERRRFALASCVFSLALLTRHEAAVLLPVWWLGLLIAVPRFNRGAALGLLALWAPLAHNIAYRLVYHCWPASIFFYPHGSTEYPATNLLSYLPQVLSAIPPLLAALAIIGGIVLWSRKSWLVPAMAGLYLVTHVGIKALGVFASGGYGRFMVAVAPFVAILVAAGVDEVMNRWRRQRSLRSFYLINAVVWMMGWLALEVELAAQRISLRDARLVWAIRIAAWAAIVLLLAAAYASARLHWRRVAWGFVAGLLLLALTIQWAALVRPLRSGTSAKQVHEVAEWLRHEKLDESPFFAANPWFAYEFDIVENPRAHKGARLLASLPVGTVLVWDSAYSNSDFHRLSLETYLKAKEYELLKVFPRSRPEGLDLYVFRKKEITPLPAREAPIYPPNLAAEHDPVLGIYYVRPR